MKKYLFILLFLSSSHVTFASWAESYPGCTHTDIIVGDQVWASCNASTRSAGSDLFSGWFLWGQVAPTLLSQNESTTLSQSILRTGNRTDWSRGPCAVGYRIPTRYEWEEVIFTARRNGSNVATLLNLPKNGSRTITRDRRGNITQIRATGYQASYWTSTSEIIGGKTPMVMHIGQTYGYNRYDTTDGGVGQTGYEWHWNPDGKELIEKSIDEIANIRCIRDI